MRLYNFFCFATRPRAYFGQSINIDVRDHRRAAEMYVSLFPTNHIKEVMVVDTLDPERKGIIEEISINNSPAL